MQAAIATLIGVLGTGLITVLLQFMRTMNSRFDRLESKVDNLTGEVHTLDTRLTGEIHALDTKFTGELKAHGERLARIEAKLDIEPPAEAA